MKKNTFWEYEDIGTVQHSQLLHDTNFNNKKKIELEHFISQTILQNPSHGLLNAIKSINKTTHSFIRYIKEHDNVSSALMHQIFFEHVGATTDQLGRDDGLGMDCRLISTQDAHKHLIPWLDDMLQQTNPSPTQLCSMIRIHVAADYVFFNGLVKDSVHQEAIDYLINDNPTLLNSHQLTDLRIRNEDTVCDKKKSVIYRRRGRIFRKEEGNEKAVLTQQFGLFPFSQTTAPSLLLPWHRRGMDWYRAAAKYHKTPNLDGQQYENSPYVCLAIRKDMPLVCSSSSTAARLMRYAAVFSTLTVKEYWQYAFVHMAYNIRSGHHTFHEMATVMRLVGIPYKDGNYASLFPAENQIWIEQLTTFNPILFSQKPDLVFDPTVLNKPLFNAFLDIDETQYEPNHSSAFKR